MEKNKINEAELTKKDINDEVVRVLKTNDIKKIINDLVTQQLKNDTKLQDEIVDITRNVMTQLFKTLWIKRSFWQSTLSNKAG